MTIMRTNTILSRGRGSVLSLLALVLFTACDRQSLSTLVLTVGTNLAAHRPAERSSDVACDIASPQPPHEALANSATIKQAQPAWRALLRSLDQLGSLDVQSGERDNAALNETLKVISTRADQLANHAASGDTLRMRACEAKFHALTLAAAQAPEIYSEVRESYGRAVFGADYAKRDLAQESVQRIVMRCLTPDQSDDETVLSLMLHARMYPDCSANVDLYATLVDRLVAKGRAPVAAALAREGLTACRGHANLETLQCRLKEIQ
jgi:hypothetical protein